MTKRGKMCRASVLSAKSSIGRCVNVRSAGFYFPFDDICRLFLRTYMYIIIAHRIESVKGSGCRALRLAASQGHFLYGYTCYEWKYVLYFIVDYMDATIGKPVQIRRSSISTVKGAFP